MVGAALHQHVAGLQVDVSVVHHHGDLAGKHDRVVDRLGAVHERMAAALAESRRLFIAQRREGAARGLRIHLPDVLGFGREMIDAQHGAMLLRHLPARAERRLIGDRHDARGRLAGAPDVGRVPLRIDSVDVNERRRTIRNDDRLTVLVMPGDDAPNLLDHRCSPDFALDYGTATPSEQPSLSWPGRGATHAAGAPNRMIGTPRVTYGSTISAWR